MSKNLKAARITEEEELLQSLRSERTRVIVDRFPEGEYPLSDGKFNEAIHRIPVKYQGWAFLEVETMAHGGSFAVIGYYTGPYESKIGVK